jgi:penicillin-binding protein 1A
MKVAVAKRPVEPFETQAPVPDWQLEPDEQAWGMEFNESAPLVDADGNPVGVEVVRPGDPYAPQQPGGSQVDQQWLDEVLRRNPENRPSPGPAPRPPPQGLPPQQQPPQQPSERPADPLQPRP